MVVCYFNLFVKKLDYIDYASSETQAWTQKDQILETILCNFFSWKIESQIILLYVPSNVICIDYGCE